MNETSLDEKLTKMENDVLDEILGADKIDDNPFSLYSVINPFELRFSLPDDAETEVIVQTKLEEVRYARSVDDVHLLKELENKQGSSLYPKEILKILRNNISKIELEDVEFSITGKPDVSLMTEEQIKEWEIRCINDE